MSANVTQSTLTCVWFNCSYCSSALQRCGSRTTSAQLCASLLVYNSCHESRSTRHGILSVRAHPNSSRLEGSKEQGFIHSYRQQDQDDSAHQYFAVHRCLRDGHFPFYFLLKCCANPVLQEPATLALRMLAWPSQPNNWARLSLCTN